MDYFNNVLATFQCLEHVRCVALYTESEISWISTIFIICVAKMNEGQGLEQHKSE